MKITNNQLKRIIREALLLEYKPGYSVPDFETTEDMMLFLDELEPDETVETDVFDPLTGEVWLRAGETPLEAGLVELEEEEIEEEPEEEELDRYDWDAYEREIEEKQRKQDEQDEKFQDQLKDEAQAGGRDWAADTLYQARSNPSMWKDGSSYQQYDSPEDYVLAFGQDAAGDVAQSVEYTINSNEMYDWYQSLPDQESRDWNYRWRITKQSVKDMYADYFYDGVAQAVKEERAA
jgi:hypothetical protein